MKSAIRSLGVAAGVCILAPSAHAAVVTVDFDALDGGRNDINIERPANFFNGGLGSLGSGPGPNFGITFSGHRGNLEPSVICNDRGLCNNPAAGNSLFVFGNRQNNLENPGVVIHIEGGFRGIVEFDASISNVGVNTALIEIKTDLDNPSNIVGGRKFAIPISTTIASGPIAHSFITSSTSPQTRAFLTISSPTTSSSIRTVPTPSLSTRSYSVISFFRTRTHRRSWSRSRPRH